VTLTVGSVLENRYRIEQLLGQGGMGAVYRAYDTRLQQSVAIKENTMAVPGISPEVVAASRHQFEREALMLARLRHPNLPRVGDHFVTPDGNQYLVMDYIEGDDLGHIIARGGPLPEAQAIAWISQACSALEYLHTQDPPIIHRDIKPQNIKVTPKGVVFLVDFGIAKVGDVSKTATGALGVTPGFSPPEQYAMIGTDARSDIYALGATLYALLTGHVPPESISLMSGEAHLMPPQQVNSTVSPVVQQTVLKAMEPRKTDRPRSVAEFRRMLEECGAKSVERPEPPAQWMGAAAADEIADKRIPATPTPKPMPAPIVPPRSAAPPAYAERVRAERNPLPYPLRVPWGLLLAGAGIVAIVLVVLIVVAISSSKGAATPAPMPTPTTIAEPTKSPEPTKVPVTPATPVPPTATHATTTPTQIPMVATSTSVPTSSPPPTQAPASISTTVPKPTASPVASKPTIIGVRKLSGTSRTMQVEVSYAGLEPFPPSARGRLVEVRNIRNSSGVRLQRQPGGDEEIPLGSSTGTVIVNIVIDNMFCADGEFKSDNFSVMIYHFADRMHTINHTTDVESDFPISHTWCGS
jgi:serine/threonine protein kinase